MVDRISQNFRQYYDILGEAIGKGGFGCVYKGKEKKTNKLRAIKIIDKSQIIGDLLYYYDKVEIGEQLKLCIDGFKTEFDNMKICSKNNNNSVKCYEYFNNDNNFIIIMELCDSNLQKLLQDRILKDNKCFNSEEIFEIMRQLNNTFKIMKENNIIHIKLKIREYINKI